MAKKKVSKKKKVIKKAPKKMLDSKTFYFRMGKDLGLKIEKLRNKKGHSSYGETMRLIISEYFKGC